MSEPLSCFELAEQSTGDRSEVLRWAAARLPLVSDEEAVHDTRVALRRMRESILGFDRCIASGDRDNARRLRKVESLLGSLRDSEVRLQLLDEVLGPVAVWRDRSDDPRLARAYGISVISKPGDATRPGLRGLETEARRLLADLTAAESTLARERMLSGPVLRTLSKLSVPPVIIRTRQSSRPALGLARQQLPALFRRAARQHSGEGDLHRRRIRTRRLRYRLELYGPVLSPEHRSVLEELRELQGMLGRFHDLAVLVEWIDAAARDQRRELRPALRRLTVRVELEQESAKELAEAELRRLDAAAWWQAAQRACLG